MCKRQFFFFFFFVDCVCLWVCLNCTFVILLCCLFCVIIFFVFCFLNVFSFYFSSAVVSGPTSGAATTVLVAGTSLPQGCVFVLFFFGNVQQLSFVFLFVGLVLDGGTSEIAGTPTGPVGVVNFRLRVQDGATFSPTAVCSINIGNVPSFNSFGQTPGNGEVGVPYTFSLNVIASNPVIVALSGQVPAGITFVFDTPTVTIQGTPESGGSFAFQVSVIGCFFFFFLKLFFSSLSG
jgi:hypothetical protein